MRGGGIHPLYGKVDSIKGRNIVYCPTERSGEKCLEIVNCLEKNGAKIFTLDPEEHDKTMAYLQNIRKTVLDSFVVSIEKAAIDIKTAYALSPPPTRIMLDLAARQANPDNDLLFKAMAELNQFHSDAERNFLKAFEQVSSGKYQSKEIRSFFEKELEAAQERAKKIV